jgi:ribosomal protein L11 methylase PrmA
MLGEGLGRLLRPAGRAILAGILVEQRGLVTGPAARAGFTLEAEAVEGDWLALVYRAAQT